MAINPIIKQKAEDIRKKVFGSEVRESLASGLEGMSEDVESIKGRQGNVENQFQNVLDETTGKDVISAPEIIAARGGHDNLSQRLLSTDQQLQHIDGAFFKSLDYLFMKNTFSTNPDQPTRFAVVPKGETTSGVGGVFKVFADDFSADQSNYRDLGIYFSQNQRGDTGHNDGGVFWFNSKAGIDGKFLDKNADMAFSFQDGETIAGRVILDTSTGVDNAVFVIGSEKSKYASLFSSLGIPIGMEVQKDIYIQPDRMIRFVNENDVGLHGIRYNSTSKKLEILFNGSVVFSLSVDGNELKNATIVNKYNSVATGTSILDGSVGGVYVVSDTTAITAVNGGTNGQEIRVLFASAGGNLKNSATLKLKGGADFVATNALSSIKLLKISSGWVEVSRNVM